jgi:hypothetical protein
MFIASTFLRSESSAALVSLSLFLTGCASEPPKEIISQAEIAIQDADRSGVSQYEPQLLGSARIKLSRAKKSMEEDENDDARRMAEEALSEANLANAKTEAAKQAQETDAMKKTIEALKQETSRAVQSQ